MNSSKAYLLLAFRQRTSLRPSTSLLHSHLMSHSKGITNPISSMSIRNHSNMPPKLRENPKITCQCGTISLTASRAEPLGKYVCHCTECQKQSASAFGISALFPSEGMWPFPKELQQHIGMWARPADSGNTVECYFCKVCGVRILHRVIFKDGTPRPSLAVKGGCVEGFNLDGAKHIYTRSALVPVPEGSDLGAPRVKP
ncbi:Mss4-like protein [Trichoderma asperelloides]|nr:Mss4-like protein [Trichoderma asperelloides]